MCFRKDVCEICGSRNQLQIHHKFPQTKLNKELYPELIHEPFNCQTLCANDHLGKKNGIVIWTEIEFCDAASEEYETEIIPRSKTGKIIYERIQRCSQ
jgi:hypothetical protein